MREFTDDYGLLITATSAASVQQYTELTTAGLGFRADTPRLLKQLLQADPTMPMAQCTKGYFAKLIGSREHSHRADTIAARLNTQLAHTAATEREHRHAAALSAWCDGQLEQALGHWEAILAATPMDGLAVRLAHFIHFYSGDSARLCTAMAGIVPHWPQTHPQYGFILGMYAFGLEEAGDYAAAERYGRQAVAINPCDTWAVHAVAHVMEMTAQSEAGIAWLRASQPHWSAVNNFRFHLYWHHCLFHLARDEDAAALALYDDYVAAEVETDFNLDLCNATSLLWRLELRGVDIGARWARLAAVAQRHTADTDLVFVSLHYLMAALGAEDATTTRALLTTLDHWAEQPNTQGRVARAVGRAIADGLVAMRRGDYRIAREHFARSQARWRQIGGSHAQRDLFARLMSAADVARRH